MPYPRDARDQRDVLAPVLAGRLRRPARLTRPAVKRRERDVVAHSSTKTSLSRRLPGQPGARQAALRNSSRSPAPIAFFSAPSHAPQEPPGEGGLADRHARHSFHILGARLEGGRGRSSTSASRNLLAFSSILGLGARALLRRERAALGEPCRRSA